MQIAITADCHLRDEYPERIAALKNIFEQLQEMNINKFIIAGDLFDKEQQNYSEFDRLAQNFSSIDIYIIPGNHDQGINSKYFTAPNINVITSPTSVKINQTNFFFVPYNFERTIDDILAEHSKTFLEQEQYVLIAHGDYLSSSYEYNKYEEGIYMPLSTYSVEKSRVLKVFLGHVHKAINLGRVFYPGSPCPVDRTETGKRQFLIYNTSTNEVLRLTITTKYIYFQETLNIFPVENEENFIKTQLDQMINSWNLQDDELNKVKLFIEIKGYSKDINHLNKIICNHLKHKGITLISENITAEVSVPKQDATFSDKMAVFTKSMDKLNNITLKELDENIVDKKDIEKQIIELILKNK